MENQKIGKTKNIKESKKALDRTKCFIVTTDSGINVYGSRKECLVLLTSLIHQLYEEKLINDKDIDRIVTLARKKESDIAAEANKLEEILEHMRKLKDILDK